MFAKFKLVLPMFSLLFFFGFVSEAQNRVVPIEDFIRQDTYSNPKLSPDGNHIAIKVRIMRNGRLTPTLTIYHLPELSIVSTMALPKFEVPLNYSWVSNTRLIMTKGIEVGLREAPRATGEVVAVDFDGKRFQYLFGYDNFRSSTKGDRYGDDHGYGSLAGIPESQNGSIFLGTHLWRSNSSSLYEIDTVKASRKLITDIPKKGLTFHLQTNGVPRFATGVDEETGLRTIHRRDEQTGNWKLIPIEESGKRYFPLLFTKDDESFYAFSSSSGEPSAFVIESMKTGNRRILAKNENEELSIEWGEKPYTPFAVVTHGGIPQFQYLDENSANALLHKLLSKQFPNAIVHFIDFTDDGNKLLFGVSSDRDPGSFYLFDKKAGTADLLFSVNAEIDPNEMAERRPIQVQSRDGKMISGFLTLPKSAKTHDQKFPLVVYPHGGPHGVKDVWYFDEDAQFLANRGYAVLQINYRGSAGRGDNFIELGYREWGGKIQDDLIDAVKQMVKEGIADGTRICTYGASFGGYSALMLPVREPNLFKCAIGYAGVYDLSYIFEEERTRTSKAAVAFFDRTLGKDLEQLAGFSPSKQAHKIKIPVWLIHGGKDDVAPPEHVYRMREALIKAGNKPSWTFEDDEGHGFYDVQRKKALYEKLESFLAEHLGKP